MLIHKKLWAESGTWKGFFLPYFLKWKIYAKTLKLTSCWVSSNKIRFVKSMYRFWKNKPHQGIILSRMLRNWSKALELFCSQNGQISFQYCFKDYFVWSIRKTGHRIQYFCNLQDYHLDIYVFMLCILSIFLLLLKLGLDCLSISRGLSLEGAELEEARDSSVLSSTPAQLSADSFKVFQKKNLLENWNGWNLK